jgi:hypothetical protein
MTTTITNTIGASGSDYATIALWEDGTDNTSLVGADEIRVGACKNEVFDLGAGGVTIAGATTDATRYRQLTTDASASFRDNANVQTNALRYNESNGCAIKGAVYLGYVIECTENYARFSGLQISAGNADSGAITHSGSNALIENSIAEGGRNGGALVISGASAMCRNTLIVGRRASAAVIANGGGSGATTNFVNCTIATPSDVTANTNGISSAYGACNVKNCAIFGATNVKNGNSTFTFTNCMTDATGTTGVTGGKTYANQFQNTADATRDFRAKTGADLVDAGTTDSTNAANDIAGTARPSGSSYDIGAWELVQVGGGGGSTKPKTLTLLGVG